MNKALPIILIGALVGLIVLIQSVFIVDEREQAILLQLGQPVGQPRGPGIHLKIPFIQSVSYFDRRILSVDPQPEQMVISSANLSDAEVAEQTAEERETQQTGSFEIISGEPIVVDTFARYKITDPLQFLMTLRTIASASSRLQDILNEATKAVLGTTTLGQLLSEQRTAVMNNIQQRVNRKIQDDQLGIEIVDVRIVRADLTSELRESTVKRMISELQERATETRAKGEERALEIRSTADKERTILLAEAQREAEVLKGVGDKKAIKIYADAFNKDPEFYSFIRSMEAYKATLANPETRMILSPESPFFKHFGE